MEKYTIFSYKMQEFVNFNCKYDHKLNKIMFFICPGFGKVLKGLDNKEKIEINPEDLDFILFKDKKW